MSALALRYLSTSYACPLQNQARCCSRINSVTVDSSNRRYFPSFKWKSWLAPRLLVRSYTHDTGTCRNSATSCTVRSWPFSLLSPAVVAAVGRSSRSTAGDVRDDDWSSCEFRDSLTDFNIDGFTAWRGACRLEDAVFSRIPNWFEWSFISATRSS